MKARDIIEGRSCDSRRLGFRGKRCVEPACIELLPMPVAGPNGVVEFLPGTYSAFLCAKHFAQWEREINESVSMSSKVKGR